MEIGENFLEMVKFLTTKKITRSEHSELTFLAMKIEQLKISKMVKFGHFTGKGIVQGKRKGKSQGMCKVEYEGDTRGWFQG
jgi:hypothetical protein